MPPDAPSPAAEPLDASAALPLALEGRTLLAGGAPLLDGLPASVTPRPEAGGCLVLGAALPPGAAPAALADFALGQLACRRWLALPKTSLYWTSPRFGARTEAVPVETQFLLLDLQPGGSTADPEAADSAAPSGGGGGMATPVSAAAAAVATARYALLLPLIDSGRFRATLRPAKARSLAGSLVLRVESGSPAVAAAEWPAALLVAAGSDPFELCQRGVRAAARLSGTARPRADKQTPPSCDVFGWCTWDAFYSMVSAAGIQEGLKALQAGGTPPRLLIIDDGWQATDVDAPFRAVAKQRHIAGAGQVSVPHTATEVELEDAALDLLMGPAEERETNTRHAVNAEVERILSFTPRALTPRQAAAANPFGRTAPWSTGRTGLLSPRLAPILSPRFARGAGAGTAGAAAASPPAPAASPPRASPLKASPLRRPASADAVARFAGQAPAGGGETPPAAAAAGASPLRPPPGLPRISAARPDPPEPLALEPSSPAGGGAAAAGPEGEPAERAVGAAGAGMAHAASGAEAELERALQGGSLAARLHAALWDRLQRGEALLLKRLKAWLDAAPSDSWRFRAFAAAATGPLLRPTLLRFYAHATEHTRRLLGVRANAKFASAAAGPDSGDLHDLGPEGGLAGVVAHLKQRYGVRHVWMWHAMMGFWAGVAPPDHGGPPHYGAQVVMPRPTPGTLEIDPSYAWVQSTLAGVGLPASPRRLHTDLHSYLRACGVDGVKVDVQGMVAHAGTATEQGGPALAASYHASLEDSAAAHFPGNSVVNCMCGSTENLYHMRDTALARISDDFYPRNAASFTTHVSTCAYNSLLAGELVICDWDMFHSNHPAAFLHAAARAISGGPVYCSDKPGHHDFALLRRLVLPDGSVLRCLLPARPTADCLFSDVNRDGVSALKVWNVNRCTAVLAAFNTQGATWSTPRRGFHFHDRSPGPVVAAVGPADLPPGRLPGAGADAFTGDVAVWADGSQELLLLRFGESVRVELPGGGGCEVFTLAAVQERGGVRCAAVGLTGMLNAGGGIASCGWEGGASAQPASGSPRAHPEHARFALSTRGTGPVLAYASAAPAAVEVAGGARVAFKHEPASGALRWEVPPGLPLDLDWALLF